jgi:hypothetical protein
MTAPAPLVVYRQFQSFLINGEYGRLADVADLDGYTERCVGLTGWTTGLQVALLRRRRNQTRPADNGEGTDRALRFGCRR